MKKIGCLITSIPMFLFGFFIFLILFIFGSNVTSTLECVDTPKEYVTIVEKAGKICDTVSPKMIAALIKTESNWNPKATSPAGAKGIAQFMPKTFAAIGKDGNNDNKIEITNPYDSIYSAGHYLCSIEKEIKHLKSTNQITGEEKDLILASYNAGIGAVKKHKGIPPFSETKNYINKINNLIENITCDTNTQITPIKGKRREAIIKAAQRVMGTPYIWGGTGAVGYDCSGLTQFAYAQAGIKLTRTTYTQYPQMIKIPKEKALPGDLIFWTTKSGDIHHVAIYAGGNMMYEAPRPGMKLHYTNIWQGNDKVEFACLPELCGKDK